MAYSRFESLHAQLGSLLENAQWLLADSAPSSTTGYGYGGYGGYGGVGGVGGSAAGGYYGPGGRHQQLQGNPPAVYSFVAMQVRKEEVAGGLVAC